MSTPGIKGGAPGAFAEQTKSTSSVQKQDQPPDAPGRLSDNARSLAMRVALGELGGPVTTAGDVRRLLSDRGGCRDRRPVVPVEAMDRIGPRAWRYNPAAFSLSAQGAPERLTDDGRLVNEAYYEAGRAVREAFGDDVVMFMQLGMMAIEWLAPARLLAPKVPDDAVRAMPRRGRLRIEIGHKPSADELRAAEALTGLGYDVDTVKPVSEKGLSEVRTADLHVHGVGDADVYTPASLTSKQIARKLEQKGRQAAIAIVNADVPDAVMHVAVRRLWGKTSRRARQIQTVLFENKGRVFRFDRP